MRSLRPSLWPKRAGGPLAKTTALSPDHPGAAGSGSHLTVGPFDEFDDRQPVRACRRGRGQVGGGEVAQPRGGRW